MIKVIGRLGRSSFSIGLTALALCCLAAQTAQPAIGSSRAGKLDARFGTGGRVLTPAKIRTHSSAFGNGILVAAATLSETNSGRILLGSEHSLVRYLPDGRLDSSFGGDGRVHVTAPAVAKFAIEDIAMDRLNRALAVGTAWDGHGGASALIARYLPSGAPDPSFGGPTAGVVLADFGFPAPTPTLQYEGMPVYRQAVTANGVAVDTEGRILVTGTERAHISACKASTRVYNYGYVARLDPSGSLDNSFGLGGIWLDKTVSWAGDPVLGSGGSPFYVGDLRENCDVDEDGSLVHLSGTGQPDLFFGTESRVPLIPDSSRILDFVVDGQGRIWTMTQPLSGESFNQAVVSRLRPNGSADTDFGKGRGRARVWLPGEESRLHAIAVDSRGRAFLAGQIASAKTVPQEKHHLLPYMRFALLRLNASGQPDRAFGRAGRVLTAFAPQSRTVATDLMIDDKNRILVGGLAQSRDMRGGRGFALSRYLNGH